MKKEHIEAIKAAAMVLPEMPTVALTGYILTARHCYDALLVQHGHAIRAKDVASLVAGYQKKDRDFSPEYIRHILVALKDGGLPIKSARSKGYWLEK